MSSISGVNSRLVATALDQMQLQQSIDTQLAVKGLDAARQQGQAAVAMLEAAADVANAVQGQKPVLTLGALASGVGQNVDIRV